MATGAIYRLTLMVVAKTTQAYMPTAIWIAATAI